ncbi:TPA: Na+/H+ antiporter subunit D [Pseudomonas aeruginosa]|uniref:Na+/H+ antiporter subunit D n=1 Tax=Pseudomonas aeruginosa TaxID=287 RepID=UPI0005B504F4|nr:Na+/H+ antiporter subunit D [Pseudomonas aeruginosa]MBG3944244.1 Na+/H+ antiporter subunit D [Pseudomonas aeruginosa]MBG5635403.1 Na+/H+ antiporter subunit D [Pseudomonas aeruginosa]MBG6973607.1 Na+/H+ antiporter subunit D [Pseudomonas aeruginosa]MBG7548729.1 Na+/H+ antiporter subunit D [Pseudomonas aeruginosa]MCU9029191.1 Na+/H+ antiporter subunit D [Pseudomonas aeruginosa]
MIEFVASQVLLWPVVIPLLASALCAVLWTQTKAQRAVSLAALAVMAIASLGLLLDIMSSGILSVTFGGWPAPFGISFVADRLSAAMVAITGILSLAVGVFGLADIRRRQEHAGFYPLLHGMLAAVNGAFLTGDIFNLYVWFEIMLITAMGLLVINRTRAQLDGTLKYAVLNLLSTLLFLLAIAIVYGVTGTLNMADLARVLPETEENTALALAAALFLIGFGIKAGYFPLFFWLPASYHTASITVAAIFAGLLTKVGVYACFRVFSLLFENGNGLREVIAVMAAGTMLFGVFGAAIQWDIRRILSFHIISQIGYMLLGLALATPLALAGAIFYIIHHIIVKANLFLVAGAIYRATGTYDLRKAGGLMTSHPLLACLFAIPALSLAGIPPLSGFWAKYMVIDASFRAESAWLAAVGLFVGLLTVFSMSKIWIEAFWKAPPNQRSAPRTVPAAMLVPIAALGLVTIWIGLQPESFVTYASAAGDALLDPLSYAAAVFDSPDDGGNRP